MIVGLTSTFLTGVFSTKGSFGESEAAALGCLARAPSIILSYFQASFATRAWLSSPSLWSNAFTSKILLVNIKQVETIVRRDPSFENYCH